MATDNRYPLGPVPASEIAEPLAAPLHFPATHYPESDGQPLGETETHRDETIDLIQALVDFFRDEPDVYVGGDLFIYYQEDNPRAVVAPDVFVIQGVPQLVSRHGKPEKRRIYKLWQESRAPSMVVEVTSQHTRNEDTERKMTQYAELGIEEYFLYDPFGDYLEPRLQGHRLFGNRYRRIQPAAGGELHSRTLGVTLVIEEERLRLRETATGELLPSFDDFRTRAREEAAARREAEERVATLEVELERLRRQLAEREGD